MSFNLAYYTSEVRTRVGLYDYGKPGDSDSYDNYDSNNET